MCAFSPVLGRPSVVQLFLLGRWALCAAPCLPKGYHRTYTAASYFLGLWAALATSDGSEGWALPTAWLKTIAGSTAPHAPAHSSRRPIFHSTSHPQLLPDSPHVAKELAHISPGTRAGSIRDVLTHRICNQQGIWLSFLCFRYCEGRQGLGL